MMQLEDRINTLAESIPPLDAAAMARARARQDQLMKPLGALGRMEDLAVQIAGMTGTERPARRGKLVVVFAADHGVAWERVSAYPSKVTSEMVLASVRGTAAVSVLARHVGARLVVVDVGVDARFSADLPIEHLKVRFGTSSFVDGPAMERADALRAIAAGVDVIGTHAAQGIDLLALGEMGIGNSTAAAATAAAITGCDPAQVVGPGSGVDDAGLQRKLLAVRRGLRANRIAPVDPIGVLAAVGGLEIAALVGAILHAAALRIPILLDGYICGVAGLVAARLAPKARSYLIAAHQSTEPGHRLVLTELDLRPLLTLDMRLGEASGSTLGLSVIEAALATHDEMATFGEGGVSGPVV